jgi:hypothetical protein
MKRTKINSDGQLRGTGAILEGHLEASRSRRACWQLGSGLIPLHAVLSSFFLAGLTLQRPSIIYLLLPGLEHVAVIHLSEPPSHPWLAVSQSLPAGVLQQRIENILLLTHLSFCQP